MNDINNMPSRCNQCPYWEIAAEPYLCIDCEEYMRNYYANKECEKQMELTSEYVYKASNPFIEFHTINECPVLINLLNISAVMEVDPHDEDDEIYFNRGMRTWICIFDDEIPVKEPYEAVKKMVGA